jgi:thioredoxin-like negative regulator of GroEL
MDRRTALFGISGLLLTSIAFGAKDTGRPRDAAYQPEQNSQTSQAAPPIEWVHDLKRARRISASTGRPMLIIVGGPWCQHCQKLETEVLGNSTVARYINSSFVPVHLDSQKDKRAVEILEVKSIPTTVVLNSEADLVGTVSGYVAVREYAQFLKDTLDYHRALRVEAMGSIRQTRH